MNQYLNQDPQPDIASLVSAFKENPEGPFYMDVAEAMSLRTILPELVAALPHMSYAHFTYTTKPGDGKDTMHMVSFDLVSMGGEAVTIETDAPNGLVDRRLTGWFSNIGSGVTRLRVTRTVVRGNKVVFVINLLDASVPHSELSFDGGEES